MMERHPVTGWIYSFEDYLQMYGLTEADFKKTILDFPGLLSDFNAIATQKGAKIQSASPLFKKNEQEMKVYADIFLEENIEELTSHPDRLLEDGNDGASHVIDSWKTVVAHFQKDYATGVANKRYLPVDLKQLPFQTHQFELALCSHLLFQPEFTLDVSPIHLLQMLCNFAQEVRLYPLLDQAGNIMEDLGPLMLALQQKNYGVEVREVTYQHRKGGNAMLRIWAQACVV